MQGHAENAAVQENACMAPTSLAANTEIEMKIVEEKIGFDINAKIVYHLLLSSTSNLSLFLSFSSLLLLLCFFLGACGLALLTVKITATQKRYILVRTLQVRYDC